MARPHRVPLSDRAVEVLKEARRLSDDADLVFPSPTGRMLSDSTISKLVRENGIACVTHGMRNSFRDWAAECSDAPREVCELALAHVNSDRVEAAYRRTDLFDRRRVLMGDSPPMLLLTHRDPFATAFDSPFLGCRSSSARPHPPTTQSAPSKVRIPRSTSTIRTEVLIGLILYFSYHRRPYRVRRSPPFPLAQFNPHRFTARVHRPRKKPASSFARSQSCFSKRLVCLAKSSAPSSCAFGGSTTFMQSRIFWSSGSNGFRSARNSFFRRDNAVASSRRIASCTNNACARIFSRHFARSAVM